MKRLRSCSIREPSPCQTGPMVGKVLERLYPTAQPPSEKFAICYALDDIPHTLVRCIGNRTVSRARISGVAVMNSNNYYAEFLSQLKSTKFQALRPAQERVLGEYLDKFEATPDIAVELPTGAGKTLIAENRRRKRQKVAILSANKTLARQMSEESQELGIPSVLMEGRGSAVPNPVKRSYQRGHSIGIMNYWVYFNQNPVIDPADLLIMDDAHLAEHCLHSLYSVEITRVTHPELFEALVSELNHRYPEYSVLADALDFSSEMSKPPELLSFIDQTQTSVRIKEIFDSSPTLRSNLDLRFR